MIVDKRSKNAAMAAFLIIIYLSTRLWRLHGFPIFSDEAYYLLISKALSENIKHFFISFQTDGKKPLSTWLTALALHFWKDPLIGGRLVTVAAGLMTLFGVSKLAAFLHGSRASFWAGFFMVISPIMAFYERIGLKESLASATAIWTMIAAFYFANSPSFRRALLLAVPMSLGFLVKDYTLIFVLFPPLAILSGQIQKRAFTLTDLRPFFAPLFSAYLVSFLVLTLVLFWPMIKYDSPFIFGMGHLAVTHTDKMTQSFFEMFTTNLEILGQIFIRQVGTVTVVFWFLAAFLLHKKKSIVFLSAFPLAWMLFVAMITQNFNTRYIVFVVPLTFVAAGCAMADLLERSRRKSKLTVAFVAFGLMLLMIPQMKNLIATVSRPSEVRLSKLDQIEYVEGWPAGFGFAEVVSTLEQIAAYEKIDVFFTPHLGLPGNGLVLALDGNPNIRLHTAYWFQKEPILNFVRTNQKIAGARDSFGLQLEIIDPASLGRCFFVIDVPQISLEGFLKLNPDASLIFHQFKPGKKSFFAILELNKSHQLAKSHD